VTLRAANKPEWFVGDPQTVAPILGVPGIKMLSSAAWQLHRSHLPLLAQDADAARLLMPALKPDWVARDLATKDRGFTLRNVQHAGVDYITQRRGALIGDEMRVGKGNRHGTPILTPTGWRPIETLAVGDQVIGSDGAPTTITGVFPRGKLPVFRVTFSDGVSTVVDGEHLWTGWTRTNRSRGYAAITLTTEELRHRLHQGWQIPLVAPVDFVPQTLPIDPYVLGVLLGDGSLSSPGVVFIPGDVDVPAEVARRLPEGLKLTRDTPSNRAAVYRVIDEVQGKNRLLDALRDFRLWGCRSWEKFVPEAYLRASVSQRLDLLRGLMDTDGELYTRKGKHSQLVQFSSSAEALVDAVRALVQSLGGVARKGYRAEPKYTYLGEKRTGRPSWRLTIAMPPGLSPFLARTGYVDRSKYDPIRTIRSIEPEGDAEVTCISVAAPDQLYVIEHFIVTHNTLACIMSHDPKTGPLVVICPAMVRPVWISWLARVFPDEPIGVLTGHTFDHKVLQNKIVVGHYEILPWWQSAMRIGTLIFDEAHMLTNRSSKRSKAAIFLSMRAERVIAATGTPIWNMPPDLWNVLGLIAPAAFGGFHEFAHRYGLPVPSAHGTKYTGISNEEELTARLSEVMIRRRWVDVADDLPPITRSVSLVELDDAKRRKLDLISAMLREAKGASSTIGMLATYREKLSTIKRPAVIKEAETILDRNEPVVIWTWHRALAEQITADLGSRAFLLTGDVPGDKRDEAIAAWKAHPAAALVCTMAVAQVGLDFSHAHLAIFAEIDYTPAILAQAEMRTYSPLRPMNITYIVADHLVDQRIVLALTRKLSAADPLGVGAANDAISALQFAIHGRPEEADLGKMLDDWLSS
jgi:hypothetical protein